MVKIIMRLMFAAAALAAALCFDIPASRAFGDAPWCAVKNLGRNDVYWDCQYRTFEACYPNALADRGFCNLNPWPGPSTPNTAAHPRHQKRHMRHV
jgi:Protein of unknown function (DUF3551)